MKIPLQSRKRSNINERLHLFAKDGKGYPFLSILLSLKTIGKSVKFQDITPIRVAINTVANGINNSYPF